MRRLLCLILSTVLLFSVTAFVFAAESSVTEEVIYYDDGSYLTITIIQYHSRSTNSTSGFKRYVYSNTDGTTEWRAILTGTFTYDGTTATCTESSVTTYVYASNWYEVSKTAGKSGNTATGSVTMGRTVLGFTVAKETYNMTLTCSPSGTIS